MLGKDPFDDPGLNAHRNELARQDQEGAGEAAVGWVGLVFVVLLSAAPLIVPNMVLFTLWPQCPPLVANLINLSAYLAIVFALTRFQWFGALPVVGSGIFLIVAAALSFFFKKGSGDFYASIAEPIFMVALGGGVIAYYYRVRSKNEIAQQTGEHE